MRWWQKFIEWVMGYKMQGFTGKGFFGLNDKDDPSLIADDELTACDDVRINDDLSIEKRKGYTIAMTGETEPILDIDQVAIGNSLTTVYATKSNVKKKVGTSQETISSGLNGVDYAQFHKFNDKLLVSNGQNEIRKCSIRDQDRVYQNANGIINVFNSSFVYLESYDISATIGTAGYGIITDGFFFYACGADKVWKFTMNFEEVASLSLTGAEGITQDTDYIYVTADIHKVYKISKSTMLSTADYNVATFINPFMTLIKTSIYQYGGKLAFFARIPSSTQYLLLLDTTTMALPSFTSYAGDYLKLTGIGAFTYQQYTGAIIQKYSMVDLSDSPAFTMAFTPDDEIYSYRDTDLIISNNGTSQVYSVTGQLIQTISSQSDKWKVGINTTTLKNNFKTWHDLCSPYKPIQNEADDASTAPNTTVTSYRYTGYNATNGLQTSGGAISDTITRTSKKNEVFFDFELSTQWTKTKADLIGVDRWKLYRKEGSNDFKLCLTSPIYWELDSTGINDSSTTLNVTSFKGGLLLPDGTRTTENFYILVNDEIMLVDGTTGGGTAWTVTRGQKGTMASAHTGASTIYIFSIIDDVATADLGGVCPIKNDYIENCKFMISHKGRFIMANSPENPSRVWYSGFNKDNVDEDLIDEDNWYDINKDDGDEITGLAIYQDNLLVFKNRSMHYLVGDLDEASVVKFNDRIGTVSQKSIQEVYNGLIFLSREGLMWLIGNQLNNLTKNQIPTWIKTINWNYAKNTVGEYYPFRNEYWISVPYSTSTTNNRVLVYKINISDHQKRNSFVTWTRSISALKLLVDDGTMISYGTNGYYLFSGDYAGGINQEESAELDGASAITSTFSTKRFNFGYNRHKKFERLTVDFEGQGSNAWNISYTYSTDKNAVGGTNTIAMGGTGYTSDRMYDKVRLIDPANPNGQYIQFNFSNNTASNLMQIYNISIDYKTGKVR